MSFTSPHRWLCLEDSRLRRRRLGLGGTGSPEFAIDFCLSLGIRTGSSEREPVRSVGGPARGQPGACRLEQREQRRLHTSGCGEKQTPLQPESSPPWWGETGGWGCAWPGRRSRWTTGWDPGFQGSILPWGGHRLVSRLPLPGLNPAPFSHSEQPCALPVAAHQPPSAKRTAVGLQRVGERCPRGPGGWEETREAAEPTCSRPGPSGPPPALPLPL